MTKAYTVVIEEKLTRTFGVFVDDQFCYIVLNPSDAFYEDLKNHDIASINRARRAIRRSRYYKTRRRQSMNGKKDINNIHQASDFKAWNHTDMAGAFWVCLGRYIKNPNEHDLTVINAAYLWAVHDNHALANSFSSCTQMGRNRPVYRNEEMEGKRCPEY